MVWHIYLLNASKVVHSAIWAYDFRYQNLINTQQKVRKSNFEFSFMALMWYMNYNKFNILLMKRRLTSQNGNCFARISQN